MKRRSHTYACITLFALMPMHTHSVSSLVSSGIQYASIIHTLAATTNTLTQHAVQHDIYRRQYKTACTQKDLVALNKLTPLLYTSMKDGIQAACSIIMRSTMISVFAVIVDRYNKSSRSVVEQEPRARTSVYCSALRASYTHAALTIGCLCTVSMLKRFYAF